MHQREDLGSRTVTIVAHVVKGGLHLRKSLASAKVEDGRMVEVDLNADGALLVTIHPPDGEGWKTYALSVSAVIEGVLAAEATEVLDGG